MRSLFLLGLLAILTFLACDDQRPQSEIDDELIRNYLRDNNITAERHSSGIYYVIQTPGTGSSPVANSLVKVKYKGYFLDGTVFDQTDGNNTLDISLQQTISGWQIAVPLLKSGGKGTFYIPSGWGYGRFPPAGIPANAVLIFDIELISFR
ncbi:MAG: FKBP-type peptidyl-prolyl cis-trans isomerase [Saprospiraceae bacterium]